MTESTDRAEARRQIAEWMENKAGDSSDRFARSQRILALWALAVLSLAVVVWLLA